MSTCLGQDPAVITWRIALAPRPRFSTGGRHWWRDYLTAAFSSATAAWELAAEAASNGWATELRDFEANHPRPRLRDFMVQLGSGAMAPDRYRTCSCGLWHRDEVACPSGGVDVPP